MTALRPLPEDLEPSRATLHAYALAVGAIPRVHAVVRPRWWHISLGVTATGLSTRLMPLPDGGAFEIRMDLVDHDVVVDTSRGEAARFSMAAGTTATQMGAQLIETVAGLGVSGGDYDTARFDDDGPRPYDPAAAAAFFDALVDVHQVLERHRATLIGEIGPVQVWPHGFDIAFEWFGAGAVEYEEDGELVTHPSQLNFGFYPGDRPYFYSNPWPFKGEVLTPVSLPHGAQWHTEGWEGSILYYDQVAGRPNGAERVAEYAAAVYAAAAPTLQEPTG